MSKDLKEVLPREIALMMTVNGPSSFQLVIRANSFSILVLEPDPEKKVILS